MKVKTYGINGLSEWHGKIKAGSLEVNVSFKGGTASPSGAQPAYFVTKDPITQFVIENSNEFKNGFIIIVMQHEVPGTHPRMAVPKPKPAAPEAEETAVQAAAPVLDEDMNAPEAENGVAVKVQKVEVSSLDDAKEYLKENFNVAASKLRNRAAILEQAEANGIEFVGI